jgi:hypothetical protein
MQGYELQWGLLFSSLELSWRLLQFYRTDRDPNAELLGDQYHLCLQTRVSQ